MLEKMRCDAESDSCCATSNNEHLVINSQSSELSGNFGQMTYFPTEVWNVLVRVKLVSCD